MKRPFTGLENVGVPFLETEQGAPILDTESETVGYVARTEPGIVALDQGDSVEIFIHYCHVDRVAVFEDRVAGRKFASRPIHIE